MCHKPACHVLVMPATSPIGRGFRWEFIPQDDGTVLVVRVTRGIYGERKTVTVSQREHAREAYAMLLEAGWTKF